MEIWRMRNKFPSCWEKRNFGDSKRIFEGAVVEALASWQI
jgi:hypothetical protein